MVDYVGFEGENILHCHRGRQKKIGTFRGLELVARKLPGVYCTAFLFLCYLWYLHGGKLISPCTASSFSFFDILLR